MLDRSHVALFIRERGGIITVDYLRDRDGRVRRFLDRVMRMARRLEGCEASVLREALRRQERRVRDARRLAGIAKTLLDACEVRAPHGSERAEEVRQAVFAARGRAWPPRPGDADSPYAEAARVLGISADEVQRLLYADQPSAKIVIRVPRWSGERLLERYNLELARGVLRDASRVEITARGGWRAIFASVKLARLMFRIERAGPRRWRVELTGPAAAFVARPQRYGARLARIVPALTRATGWELRADVVTEGREAIFQLTPSAPIGRPRGRRARYDSSWEKSLAAEFEAILRADRAGWTMRREETPIAVGGTIFLPDFTLRNADGREVIVEVVGFWTPDYLREKLAKIHAAALTNLVLVVYRGLAVGDADLPDATEIVWFANKPAIGPVLAAADRVGTRSVSA